MDTGARTRALQEESARKWDEREAWIAAVERARGEQVVRSLEQAQFAGVRKELLDAGVAVTARVFGAYSISRVHVHFERGAETVVVGIGFSAYEVGEVDAFIYIADLCDKSRFYVSPLSVRNMDRWAAEAVRVGLPVVLHDVCRFTEFLVALVAPLGTKDSFDLFYRDVFETHEVDGVRYYAGHGGRMPVMFVPQFASNGVCFGAREE